MTKEEIAELAATLLIPEEELGVLVAKMGWDWLKDKGIDWIMGMRNTTMWR